jgi:ribose transport system ATP-binding protein
MLEMIGISKSFPGVQALQHVDLTIEPGRVHALIGKNGAGKSTLMKILSGVETADAGELRIDGRPVQFRRPVEAHAAGVAIVHQELSLVPELSVAENIFLGNWPRRAGVLVGWSELNAAAARVLDRLDPGISPYVTTGTLKVARQQLVEIAKALAREPRYLVLDEPTSALSDADADKLLEIVASLARRGVGLVYISHRLNEIERCADDITVLRNGRSVGRARIADIDRSAIISMMLGEDVTLASVAIKPEREVVLSVRGLSRGGVLRDVSFDLHKGEVLGVAGLVGAGRTELMRAIFGVDAIDAGEIQVAGQRVARPAIRTMKKLGVGFLPEDRKHQSLILDLSVSENAVITILRRLSSFGLMSRSREEAAVQAVIRDLHVLVAHPGVAVRTLSGGNQQKVVIGKWLATKPRVLLLDEPTRGIDVQAKAQIFQLLGRLAANGLSIIFVSSEIEEVLLVSHRVLTMARGRIVQETPADAANLADIMLSAAA